MKVEVFDECQCLLGEGPIWNSLTQEMMWVDIKKYRIIRRSLGVQKHLLYQHPNIQQHLHSQSTEGFWLHTKMKF